MSRSVASNEEAWRVSAGWMVIISTVPKIGAGEQDVASVGRGSLQVCESAGVQACGTCEPAGCASCEMLWDVQSVGYMSLWHAHTCRCARPWVCEPTGAVTSRKLTLPAGSLPSPGWRLPAALPSYSPVLPCLVPPALCRLHCLSIPGPGRQGGCSISGLCPTSQKRAGSCSACVGQPAGQQ